jgi:uncharacterized protein (TIGR02996 family)
MPRYELTEGASNKFWQIELEGTSFTTTYGKVGTTGQTTVKSFADEAAAATEYDKLIAAKVKKGYQLVDGGTASAAAPSAGDPQAVYQQALTAIPNDRAAAVGMLRRAAKAGFDVGAELINHAVGLARAGKRGESHAFLAALTEALPSLGDGWYHRGLSLAKDGKFPESIAATSEAIKRMPGFANAFYSRAGAFALSGQTDQALADVASALEIDPGLRDEIRADADFKSLAGDQRFLSLLAVRTPTVNEDSTNSEDAESGKARYELVEDGSSKFWEIELDGSSFTTTYGRIGAAGQSTSKDFGSDGEAEEEYQKLVCEKVKKGYQLVSGAPVGAVPAGRSNPELEAAIRANPDDPQAYLVYADWLQSQNDPRGELIVLQHTKATNPGRIAAAAAQEQKLLEKHPKELLGPVGKDPERFTELEWRFGYFRKVKIALDYDVYQEGYRLERLLKALLEHPSSSFLEELVLGAESFEGECNYQKPIDVLVKLARPQTLRSLFIADFTSEECEVSWSRLGNAGKLYAAFPGLRKLTFHAGSMNLGKIDLPELREFHVRTGGLSRKSIKDLCAASWPRLETLEIWFGNQNYGAEGTLKDIAPLLAGANLPRVKHLGLMNAEFTDEICAALPGSKILAQLESLDLTMGCMTAAGVDAILAAKGSFAHLKRLDVSNNAVAGNADKKLKGICAEVITGKHSPDRVQEDHRYTAVGE